MRLSHYRLAIMRAQHTSHSFQSFPVYSSSFISDNELVLGGGGGAARSGIKNKLVRQRGILVSSILDSGCQPQKLYNVGQDRSIEMLSEFELEAGEDAPMSMATNIQACFISSHATMLQLFIRFVGPESCLWHKQHRRACLQGSERELSRL